MKLCMIPRGLSEALKGMAKKITSDKDQTCLLGYEDETLVVMTWDKYQELINKANNNSHVHYYPYTPYTYTWNTTKPYWNTKSGGTIQCSTNMDLGSANGLAANTTKLSYVNVSSAPQMMGNVEEFTTKGLSTLSLDIPEISTTVEWSDL